MITDLFYLFLPLRFDWSVLDESCVWVSHVNFLRLVVEVDWEQDGTRYYSVSCWTEGTPNCLACATSSILQDAQGEAARAVLHEAYQQRDQWGNKPRRPRR